MMVVGACRQDWQRAAPSSYLYTRGRCSLQLFACLFVALLRCLNLHGAKPCCFISPSIASKIPRNNSANHIDLGYSYPFGPRAYPALGVAHAWRMLGARLAHAWRLSRAEHAYAHAWRMLGARLASIARRTCVCLAHAWRMLGAYRAPNMRMAYASPPKRERQNFWSLRPT